MNNIHMLSALQAKQAMQTGELSCEALIRSCLERIETQNELIHAFTVYDRDAAIEQARIVDREPGDRVLRGIPFAVKDVIETRQFNTTYGSEIYKDHRPIIDAACVTSAQEHGAIALGKVATGEFATQTPSRARNPLNLAHTPGGSSSGSAAAVAAGMVPVAFGTQTTASIIRPAVYCGVVGYKPTFNFINTAGMKPLSPSQDTLGLITRDVPDAAYFAFGLQGAKIMLGNVLRPRIGICLSRQWEHASVHTTAAIDGLIARLENQGVSVSTVQMPDTLQEHETLQSQIFAFEAMRSLSYERIHHHTELSPRLRERLAAGNDIQPEEYLQMRLQVENSKADVQALFYDVDALLYPASESEADLGFDYAGSPRFGALWTLWHVPCVSFSIGEGPTGLPLGVQLVGAFGDDARLLAVANYVHQLTKKNSNRVN